MPNILAPSTRFSEILALTVKALTGSAAFAIGRMVQHAPSMAPAIVSTIIVTMAPLVATLRAFFERRQGVPAPYEVQQLSCEIASALGVKELRVCVVDRETGGAALRGVTRRNRRVSISLELLQIPHDQLRSVLAHEYGHMAGYHRSQAVLVFSFAWSFPQLFIGALIWRSVPSFEESVLLAAAVGALTATGMLLYYHLLRAQEFEADLKVAKLIGGSASASLAAHLATEESHEARIRVLASHPSNDDRIDRLETHTLRQANLPAP